MQFSFAQLALLAATISVASAAPMDASTGLEARDAPRLHFREVVHARKTSDEDDEDSSRLVIKDILQTLLITLSTNFESLQLYKEVFQSILHQEILQSILHI